MGIAGSMALRDNTVPVAAGQAISKRARLSTVSTAAPCVALRTSVVDWQPASDASVIAAIAKTFFIAPSCFPSTAGTRADAGIVSQTSGTQELDQGAEGPAPKGRRHQPE